MATMMIVRKTAPRARLAIGAPVGPEVARRRIEGRIDEDRRHEERERQFGIEYQRGRAGNEREPGAGECHECRVRCADATGKCRQRRTAEEQRDDNLEDLHPCSSRPVRWSPNQTIKQVSRVGTQPA